MAADTSVGGGKSGIMAEAEFDVDPGAALFFVSYARAGQAPSLSISDRDPDRYVVQFFEDLSIHVRELVGRPIGADPGFLDRSMSGGVEWTAELLHAAGHCQVFIPLISASLLSSEWCALELRSFSRRLVINRATGSRDRDTAIVPVTWSPISEAMVPPMLRSIQVFSPPRLPDSIVARYQQEGIYGLRTLRDEDAYQAVVWRLAQRVVQLHRSHWVAPMEINKVDQLRNFFSEEVV
jgi:hypothetical protein